MAGTETKPDGTVEDAPPNETVVETKTEVEKPIVPPKTVDDLAIAPAAEVDLDTLDYAGLLNHAGLAGQETAMAEAFLKDGKLTDDQYAKLKKVGVTKALANRQMSLELESARAQHANIAAYQAEAESVAGGAEQLGVLRQWASVNMPPAKLKQLGDMVKADPSSYPDMIAAINRHYVASNGGRSSNRPGAAAPTASPVIKDAADRSKTIQAAASGDKTALKRIENTSLADIMQL